MQIISDILEGSARMLKRGYEKYPQPARTNAKKSKAWAKKVRKYVSKLAGYKVNRIKYLLGPEEQVKSLAMQFVARKGKKCKKMVLKDLESFYQELWEMNNKPTYIKVKAWVQDKSRNKAVQKNFMFEMDVVSTRTAFKRIAELHLHSYKFFPVQSALRRMKVCMTNTNPLANWVAEY